MTIRAEADSRFLLKYLLIGLGCIGFGMYSIYDGFVSAPAQMPMAAAWDELKKDPSLDDADRSTRYKEIAKENGWPSKRIRKTVEEIEIFVIYQYIFMGIGFSIGIPCLLWYLKTRGSWIESSENGLNSSWGQELTFDQITQFDKKKWEKKGIGVLHFDTPKGSGKFVVDDLKYSRVQMDEIVCLIESRIASNLIVNGDPEQKEKQGADANKN